MPLYINTNVASLTTQRGLLHSGGELNKVFARLSTGLRINTAGDDAAGLAISNRMTSQIRGLTQAVRNANDGISVSQVAEGALAEHSNMLQRMNELAVQAANATNSDEDRVSLQQEINQLLGEMERVAQETEFNNWPMLNGKTQPLVFQVGARADQTVTVNLADARANTLLALPQLSNPNAAESVLNAKVKGMAISAPKEPKPGSKLFSSSLSVGINALANADDSKPAPWAIVPNDAEDSMIKAFGFEDNATDLKTKIAAADPNDDAITAADKIIADNPQYSDASGLGSARLSTIITAHRKVTDLADTTTTFGQNLDAAITAATAASTSSAAYIGGTGDQTQASTDAAAATTAATALNDTKYTVALAMGTAPDVSLVIEKGVEKSGVKDVPVGNIKVVVDAFRQAISLGADIETAAAAAREADAGTNGKKDLGIDVAKIIAAGGKAAAQTNGTVANAMTAGVNMAKVMDVRNAAVTFAADKHKPLTNEKLVVPDWLIDTTGQNRFPPVPLVDITGASVPTDPTMPFDPPTTNATNPPLNGSKAAAQMLSVIAGAIDRVSSTRAELGAIQNRFEANIANLSNVVENVSAARSRILDADIAAETANLTQLSIMQQAATAILAQANQQPQLALQLLK